MNINKAIGISNRKKKVPGKILYNIDSLISSNADPKRNIVMGP